jgi:hypothetical protein
MEASPRVPTPERRPANCLVDPDRAGSSVASLFCPLSAEISLSTISARTLHDPGKTPSMKANYRREMEKFINVSRLATATRDVRRRMAGPL